MSSIDIDNLLAPVSAEEPCGPDLEYDPELAELEQASKGKPEQQYGDTLIEAEEPDWKSVRKLASSLLLRSKDLRVAIQLGNACLSLGDLEGFRDSLRFTNTFISDFWEGVYPRLDADDDNDPTERVNAVAALLAPGGTMRLLREFPLVHLQGVGQFSYADIERALAHPDSDQPPTLATVTGAFQDCDYDTLLGTEQAFGSILEQLTSIENQMSLHVGNSSAVNMSPINGLVQHIQKTLQEYLQKRGASTDETEEMPEETVAGTGEIARPAPKQHDGEIRGREDVIRALDRICEYYEKHEPSSPLPLLLNRAKRLATKSFMEIIRDLTPDALGQASSIGGMDSQDTMGE